MRRAAFATLVLALVAGCDGAPAAGPDARPPVRDARVDGPADAGLEADAEAPGDGARPDAGPDAPDASSAPSVALVARLREANALVVDARVRTAAATEVELEVASAKTPPFRTRRTPADGEHEIAVVGLRANTAYGFVAIAYEGGLEVGRSASVSVTTGAVPLDLPAFQVVAHRPDKVQPGVTLLSPMDPTDAAPANSRLVFLGVDEEGEVVWYYRTDDTPRATSFARQLPDGNLFLALSKKFRVITPDGRTVWELHDDDVRLDLHHDAVLLPNGNLLAMGAEAKEVEVPSLGGAVQVVADVLYELDPARQVVWQWHAFDHLDATRVMPVAMDSAGKYQLTHGNALQYLPDEDAVLYSARNQGWVVKVSRPSGEVLWRLGAGGDFALLGGPAAGASWFYDQHTPVLLPDGTLLAYDNGNDREPLGEARFSRAVRYRVDQAARTAELAWQARMERYTPILGSVEPQANGNVLVCAGAPEAQGGVVPPARVVEFAGDTAEEVWELELPRWRLYRATRVPSLR